MGGKENVSDNLYIFLNHNIKILTIFMTEKRWSICLYSTAYIIVLPGHMMYCISYFNFPMWHLENFLNSFKEKHNTFLAYIYASPWNSQKLRHRVTGLIFR